MSKSGFYIYTLELLNKRIKSHNKRVGELREDGFKENFTDIRDLNNYGKKCLRTYLKKGEEHEWVETMLQESRK